MSSSVILIVAIALVTSSSMAAGGVAMLNKKQGVTAGTRAPGSTGSPQGATPSANAGSSPGGTTAPQKVATKPPVYTKQQCRDAVYRWVVAVQKSGAAATGGWYDVSLGSEVRKICGGCFKKDEAGLMFGKAIGLKRYPDQWDDQKISKVADDDFHQWAASWLTEKLPGTCSSS